MAFVAIHLLLVIGAAVFVATSARLGRRVLILHLVLLAGVNAVAFAAAARAPVAPKIGRGTRLVFAAAGTTAAAFLSLLYIGTIVGHRSWGGGINYQIVRQYAGLLAPDTSPFFIPVRVHLSLAAVALASFAAYWWAAGFVIAGITSLAARAAPRRIRVATAIYVCALGASASAVYRGGLGSREPITGFFMRSDGVFDAGQYSVDRELSLKAARARAAYPHDQAFTKRNVILVVVDALRADRMSVYGYARPTTPFLAGLKASGRLKPVELALSSCAESNCGILSTLTSRPFRRLAPHNFSLGELLQDQGYEVYQLLSGNHDWNGLRQAYGESQTLYFDGSRSTRYAVNDDRAIFEGLERVRDFSGTPAFFQFHLMSVHFAGIKLEEFQRYKPFVVRQDFASLLNSPQDLVALGNNYDNGVLQADATIRDLFSALDRKGYLANSLVVILADHGEGLGDRDNGPNGLGHVHSLHQEFIRIPLLFVDAPEAPYANLGFATQVDVAPTVVDRLGLAVPPSWEGRSLLDPAVRRYSYFQTSRWNPCYAIVDRTEGATYKLLRCEEGRVEELYDLLTDPAERRNLISTASPGLVEGLRRELEAHLVGRAGRPDQ